MKPREIALTIFAVVVLVAVLVGVIHDAIHGGAGLAVLRGSYDR